MMTVLFSRAKLKSFSSVELNLVMRSSCFKVKVFLINQIWLVLVILKEIADLTK